MTAQFVPKPSCLIPINPRVKCGEEGIADDNVCADEYEDCGPINFHVTLPTLNGITLNFNCRDKSSGVLLPTEPKAPETKGEGMNDPFFFEKGFYLEAKTGFQPWPGSRLMVEAFTCMENAKMKHWQERIANNDLNVLELGAGIGLVGSCLAAAGARVIITDLPVLAEHGIWPNIRRNGKSIPLDQVPEEVTSYLLSGSQLLERDNLFEPTPIGEGWACPAALDWCKPVSEQLSHETSSAIDVIIACDCLFLRKLIDPCLDVISSLFLQMKLPRLLFTFQRRHLMGVFIGLEELLELMERRRWNVECIAWRTIEVEGDGQNGLYLFEVSPKALLSASRYRGRG